MPELPEVEVVCRRLRNAAAGSVISGVRIHRCASPSVAELAPGRRIEAIERRAKHILIRLSGDYTLHVHLRMTGNLRAVADHRLVPESARVVFEFAEGGGMIYEDSRCLGRLDVVPSAEMDAAMSLIGPEPFGPDFAGFARRAAASRMPAKLYLMDQRKVAGLGNIYAAEALYEAGVNPRRAMGRVTARKREALEAAIVRVLTVALNSVEAAYSRPGTVLEGVGEGEAYPVAVYGREGMPCPRCGRAIRRIPQGGRSTYYCPQCQR